MPRTGLSRRLQQQSRRSGFAVGLSMVVAIAICFAAFTWIYVQLEPWVQDFAGAEQAPPTPTSRPAAESGSGDDDQDEEPAPTQAPEPDPDTEPEPDAEDEQEAEIEERPTEESEAFEPDYQVTAGQEVNFRSEATNAAGGASIILVIPSGTPLEATGETAPSDSEENGPWRQFRLEDGTEGWLREVDVSQT